VEKIRIDKELLDKLAREAKISPRKRMNFNFHESLDAKAQRLLNAMEPGTVLPIHRHQQTAETYLLLKGKMNIIFYNDDKTFKDKCLLSIESGNYGIHIPANSWHTVEVIESSVIMEIKDGPYLPLTENDILK
jgi:cupin fold WbuC family metalloprotein